MRIRISMKRSLKIAVSSLVLLLVAQQFSLAKEWEQVKFENGAIVYQQAVNDNQIFAVKGEAKIESDVITIMSIISNNKIAERWMPMVSSKRTVKVLSPTSRIEYIHIKMPWPMTDRYFVTQSNVEQQEDGSIRIRMKSVTNPPFLETDKVLGFFHESNFWLVPVDDGRRTLMTVEIQSDPKGLIPIWMINESQINAPTEFFNGLRAELKRLDQLD